jgi:glyoxylase-like metal-dependent hydrolase (beta-lactamase superfamily II)
VHTFEIVDGIYGLDLEIFDTGVIAAYLIDDEHPTLIDTGPRSSAELLFEGLRDIGVSPDQIQHLIVSHCHIDHAGSVAPLLARGSDLQVYVHDAGASHLVSPDRLIDGSKRVMGAYFDEMGRPDPVPEGPLVRVPDAGVTVETGSRALEVLHTPGHARDHLSVFDPQSRTLFANEALGAYFEAVDCWLPPATLPQFDVSVARTSIETLESISPAEIALSHFGAWERSPEQAFERARRTLDHFDRRIVDWYETTGDTEAVVKRVEDELVPLTPDYDSRLASYLADVQAKGYLKYHELE